MNDDNKKIYKLVKFCPAISTENMGDHIIEYYCDRVIKDIFGEAMMVSLPIRDRLSRLSVKQVGSADYALVCGTNLLSSDMKHFRQWKMKLLDAVRIRYGGVNKKELFDTKIIKEKAEDTHVVLMGVGWYQYQDKPTDYTKKVLSIVLDKKYLHSVRDSYAEEKLAAIGITNVVNTACPSRWELTPEKCAMIPRKKADSVVTTLTNYNKKSDSDKQLLECLMQCYKTVYIWIQAIDDLSYLKKLGYYAKVEVVPPTLTAYENILASDIDYVGTRLHGGIHALNYGKRSLILAVDNRALEIARDTNLPVIKRECAREELMEAIMLDRETSIKLPLENIRRWKEQFLTELF